MDNISIRELKLSAFNRALLILSRAIEIERQMKELVRKKLQLQQNEERREVEEERLALYLYQKQLKKLAAYIFEFVFEGNEFFVQKEDLKEEFAEEYIYLLTDIELLDDEVLPVNRVFSQKTDLILLLYDKYGREHEDLITEIAEITENDQLSGYFTDYFE